MIPDSRRCFDWEKVHTDTDVRKKLTELTHIRSCTAITDGNVELAAENGMLCVRRKAGGEGVSLYINMTEEQRRQEHCLKADSKVLSAHRASVLPAAGDGKMTCGVCRGAGRVSDCERAEGSVGLIWAEIPQKRGSR